jgi:hypothetical protein
LSARSNSAGGTVTPIAFAVLRLITRTWAMETAECDSQSLALFDRLAPKNNWSAKVGWSKAEIADRAEDFRFSFLIPRLSRT